MISLNANFRRETFLRSWRNRSFSSCVKQIFTCFAHSLKKPPWVVGFDTYYSNNSLNHWIIVKQHIFQRCKSLSFCDFTSKIKTNKLASEKLDFTSQTSNMGEKNVFFILGHQGPCPACFMCLADSVHQNKINRASSVYHQGLLMTLSFKAGLLNQGNIKILQGSGSSGPGLKITILQCSHIKLYNLSH